MNSRSFLCQKVNLQTEKYHRLHNRGEKKRVSFLVYYYYYLYSSMFCTSALLLSSFSTKVQHDIHDIHDM